MRLPKWGPGNLLRKRQVYTHVRTAKPEPVSFEVPLIFAATSLDLVLDVDGPIPDEGAVLVLDCEDKHGGSLGPEQFIDVEWSHALGSAFHCVRAGDGEESTFRFRMTTPVQRVAVRLLESPSTAKPSTLSLRRVRWSVGDQQMFSSGIWNGDDRL